MRLPAARAPRLERIRQLVEWPSYLDEIVIHWEAHGAISLVAHQHLHRKSEAHCFAPFLLELPHPSAFLTLPATEGAQRACMHEENALRAGEWIYAAADTMTRVAVLVGRKAKTAFENMGDVAQIAKAIEKNDVADAAVQMLWIFDHLATFIDPRSNSNRRIEVPSNASRRLAWRSLTPASAAMLCASASGLVS